MVKHCILFFFLLVFYNLQLASQNIREWINIECYQTDNYSYKNSQKNNDLVVFMGNSITEGWLNQTVLFGIKNALNPQYTHDGVHTVLNGYKVMESLILPVIYDLKLQ